MALISPGVQVNVIDESFYTPAEPGTVPLIFIATKGNKTNPSGTGIAPGTLAANAGKLYLISSQRELSETFGDAIFYTDENNNPIHGSEQNEYGLQAAYSFLGVSNRAYVIRADIDLGELNPSAFAPTGSAAPGSYWLDLSSTQFGVFEWNGAPVTSTGGQKFSNRVPLIITDTSKVVDFEGQDYTPKSGVGSIGDYAIVAVTNKNKLWYKNYKGIWTLVGSEDWRASHPIVISDRTPAITNSATIELRLQGETTVNVTTGTTLQSLIDAINDALIPGVTADNIGDRLAIFNNGSTSEFLNIAGDSTIIEEIGLPSNNATYASPELEIAPHTRVPTWKSGDGDRRPTGSIWVKTTTPNLGANWSVKRYRAETASWDSVPVNLYANNQTAIAALDSIGGGSNLREGNLYVKVIVDGDGLATFRIYRRSLTGATRIRSSRIQDSSVTPDTYTIRIAESIVGQSALSSLKVITFTAEGDEEDADVIAAAINNAGFVNVVAEVDSQNRLIVRHDRGGEILLVDDENNSVLSSLFAVGDTTNYFEGNAEGEYVASLWAPLNYVASTVEPRAVPENGTLWYSSIVDEVDLMVHDGDNWVGYANVYPDTDELGPIVSASVPLTQRSGSSLVEGDIWISTADIENYPTIYRYNALGNWDLVDKSDQTTEDGILFADARYNTSGASSDVAGSIEEMRSSDYVDFDAPDAALYPRGMLLWNLRRSGFNVKRYVKGYVDTTTTNIRFNNESMNGYYADRWVTESQNNDDGSGSFGRNAQRKVVVQSLQALVNSNQDIRDDESRVFNLMACPAYPELIGEMISLNFDRGLTAFIIGDSPMRLTPDTTSINDWANNVRLAVEDNEFGLVSRDEYLGVYYPSGFTSDNRGNNVVVPPSHMALRTIALNDQVAYPWFAPAGTRRGGVTNATATGYISSEGEFVSIALNEGQRDTLYQANVNPITFITGSGLVVFGQKTRARNASALDRINVARLVIYLRRQLSILAKPYLFEPNDKITRDEIKQQVESLLVELVGLRALYDYLVVCDESNNTPARIDRNELYVDIAIEPVKAIEFIYIPLRLKNTGEIAGL
jgi:hypothetical protein